MLRDIFLFYKSNSAIAQSIHSPPVNLEGLESAALSESEIAHWGPMTGSIMESGGQFWGVLPLSSVVAVVVTVERVHLNG